MQLVLLGILLVGGWYFICIPRRLDAFTVAFFSAALYFLPGFLGYTLSPVTPDSPIKLPIQIESEVLAIMAAALGSITVGAVLWDEVSRFQRRPRWRLETGRSASLVALAIAIVGLMIDFIDTGGQVFAPDKRVVIEAVGRGHDLWATGASVSAVLAFMHRQRVVLCAAMLLLLLDMWIGFRYAFALTLISLIWVWLVRPHPFKLSSLPMRYTIGVFLGGLLVISYQNLKEPVREGDWGEVVRRTTDPLWYVSGILTSEPFTTQTVLNEIVRRDFRTDADHIWSTSEHLIIFSSSLGAETVRFNDLYQPALFPRVDHGLANNVWAQMWSAGGWAGLTTFLVIFVVGLSLGSWLVRSPDPLIQAGAALVFSYWAFYFHRNELLVQVGYEKKMLLVWGACAAAGILLDRAVERSRRHARSAASLRGGESGPRS